MATTKKATTETKSEFFSGIIKTPRGTYTPTGNEVMQELINAARSAGLSRFKVLVNGQPKTAEELKAMPAHIDELMKSLEVVDGQTPIAIVGYDKAGVFSC